MKNEFLNNGNFKEANLFQTEPLKSNLTYADLTNAYFIDVNIDVVVIYRTKLFGERKIDVVNIR